MTEQREIKFRAWANGSMHTVAVLDVVRHPSFYFKPFEGWSDEHIGSPRTGRVINREATDFALMQYTGLKDKNGTEIYEGDIVNLSPDPYKAVQVVVRWDEDAKAFYANSWSCGQPVWKHAVVIGNIYERPELLEASE